MGFRKSYGSLVGSYESFKENSFWGVGQRRIKLFLNSLIERYQKEMIENSDDKELKRNFMLASLYRVLLETEGCNINAKKYCNTSSFSYSDHNYRQKHQLIREACMLCLDYNREFPEEKIVYGYANSDVYNVKYIVYFELPDNGEQVSFHTDLDYNVYQAIPEYKKPWDGISESTLPKLEDAICERFGDEIRKKYKKEIAEHEEEMRKREEERIRREQQRLEEKRKQEERRLEEKRKEDERMKVIYENGMKIIDGNDTEAVKKILKSLNCEYRERFNQEIMKLVTRNVVEKYYGDYDAFYNKLGEIEKERGKDSVVLLKKILNNIAYKSYSKKYSITVRDLITKVSNELYDFVNVYNSHKRNSNEHMRVYGVQDKSSIYVENFIGSGKNFIIDICISKKKMKKIKKNKSIDINSFGDDAPKRFELKDIDTLL